MRLDFLTPDIWDGLVIGIVLIGLAFAALRLYSDFSRPIVKENRAEPGKPRPREAGQDERSGKH